MEAAERFHRLGGLVARATRADVLLMPAHGVDSQPGASAFTGGTRMDQNRAGEIAALLNTRNQLVKKYDAKAILAAHARFLFEVRDDQVVGCVEVKKVQWYQAEVNHLTVHKDYCRRGIAQALLAGATARAIQDRARILQCTIRDNNVESTGLFLKNGFVRTALFLYPDSGNNVGVYQKVISPPKAAGLSAATDC